MLIAGVSIWWWLTPRGVGPRPAYPVVELHDTPGVAVTKSHARYLLNFADSLDEFADKAADFPESGDAAKWFLDRTASARSEAYAGSGGFDAYVFGHAGGTGSGEDRYDANSLATGAKQMAAACREAAGKIQD